MIALDRQRGLTFVAQSAAGALERVTFFVTRQRDLDYLNDRVRVGRLIWER